MFITQSSFNMWLLTPFDRVEFLLPGSEMKPLLLSVYCIPGNVIAGRPETS